MVSVDVRCTTGGKLVCKCGNTHFAKKDGNVQLYKNTYNYTSTIQMHICTFISSYVQM